jgi:acid phosphatase type 7
MALPTFVRRVVRDAARLLLTVLAGASIAGAQEPGTGPNNVPAAIFVTWDGDPTTTVSVDWHLATGSDIPAVEVRGPGLSTWRRYQGSTIAFPFSSRRVRRARIDGLRPGSAYEFRFGGSRRYTYRTMPTRLTRRIRFAAGGDTQAGEATFGAMNRIVALRDVDFVLLGGDLAYSNGDPRLVAREEAWYETITRTLVTPDRRLIPVIAAIGNHEVFSTRDTSEATARTMRETGVRRGDAPYYTALHAQARDRQYSVIDVGDYLSLVLLNTGHTAPVQGAQTEWLEDALRQRPAVPYVFPIYHVPGYPSVRAFEGSTSVLVREHWAPLFERFGVRVAFENHDHAYKRTVPIKAGRRDSTGVVYIGDGAWGAVPRPIGREHPEPAWYLETAKSVNHAIFVTLDARAARFEMVDTAGVRFDTHRTRARCATPAACQ